MSRDRSLAPHEILHLMKTISPSNSECEELSDFVEDEFISISGHTSFESDADIEESPQIHLQIYVNIFWVHHCLLIVN